MLALSLVLILYLIMLRQWLINMKAILCMTGMARQCMGMRLLVEVVWLQSFLMRTVHSW